MAAKIAWTLPSVGRRGASHSCVTTVSIPQLIRIAMSSTRGNRYVRTGLPHLRGHFAIIAEAEHVLAGGDARGDG